MISFILNVYFFPGSHRYSVTDRQAKLIINQPAQKIIEAIASDDTDGAKLLLKKHIENTNHQ